MALYRFLFAPVLLAVAVFVGSGQRPRPAPPAPTAVHAAPAAEPTAVRPAVEARSVPRVTPRAAR